MYSVQKIKFPKKSKKLNITWANIHGFLMTSKKGIVIEENDIFHLEVMNKKMVNPMVSKKVNKKFDQLMSHLTELFIESDDEDGEVAMEVLNQIEKFRLQIKNKYREYLSRQQLEKMSKKLQILQKEATRKMQVIQNEYYALQENHKRGK